MVRIHRCDSGSLIAAPVVVRRWLRLQSTISIPIPDLSQNSVVLELLVYSSTLELSPKFAMSPELSFPVENSNVLELLSSLESSPTLLCEGFWEGATAAAKEAAQPAMRERQREEPGKRRQRQELRSLGARKFVNVGVGRIGCTPYALAINNRTNGSCVEEMNSATSIYNAKLRSLVDQLNNKIIDGSRCIFVNNTARNLGVVASGAFLFS